MMTYVVSCGEWPPHESDAIKYFHEKKSNLELLRDELIKDNLIDAGTHLLDSPSVAKIREEHRYQPELTYEQIEKYKKLFHETGAVTRIMRNRGDDLYLYNLLSGVQTGLLRYVNSPTNTYSAMRCFDEFKDIECGSCDVQLDKNWWLNYSWWSDLGYDGSTPYNEEELIQQLDKCQREGFEEIMQFHLTKTSAGVGS